MRFKITLNRTSTQNSLPASYQYELSAWIYRLLENADTDYSEYLHTQGHQVPNSSKNFKLFCFSNLFIRPFEIHGDRLYVIPKKLHFFVSFYVDKTAEHFILGLFRDQQFRLGDKISQVNFTVENVEVLPLPAFTEEMTYNLFSPVVVGRENVGKQVSYLPPTDEQFAEFAKQNLCDKYLSIHTNLPTAWQYATFEILPIQPEKAQSKLVVIKANTLAETKVKGYQRFQIQMTAPIELHELVLMTGFGQKNSQGFGYCSEVN